jgi:hypothetical protein
LVLLDSLPDYGEALSAPGSVASGERYVREWSQLHSMENGKTG